MHAGVQHLPAPLLLNPHLTDFTLIGLNPPANHCSAAFKTQVASTLRPRNQAVTGVEYLYPPV